MKLKYEEPLSNLAFNLKLRHYHMVTIGDATDGEDALSFPPPSPLLMARAYAETSLSFLRGKPDIAGFKNAIEHYKLDDLKSESPWLDGDTLLNCRQVGPYKPFPEGDQRGVRGKLEGDQRGVRVKSEGNQRRNLRRFAPEATHVFPLSILKSLPLDTSSKVLYGS